MKKILAIVLAITMLALVSCSSLPSTKGMIKKSVGGVTKIDIYYGSANGKDMTGFNVREIKGIASGAFAAPVINSLPFIAYVFKLDGTVPVDEFKNTLKENCDLVWNICTSADTVICESEGEYVLFAMIDMDGETGLPKGTDEKIINNFRSIFK